MGHNSLRRKCQATKCSLEGRKKNVLRKGLVGDLLECVNISTVLAFLKNDETFSRKNNYLEQLKESGQKDEHVIAPKPVC